MAGDSLDEFGGFVSLHWSLTTDLGQPVTLVYDYQEFQTISWGTDVSRMVATTSTSATLVGHRA